MAGGVLMANLTARAMYFPLFFLSLNKLRM